MQWSAVFNGYFPYPHPIADGEYIKCIIAALGFPVRLAQEQAYGDYRGPGILCNSGDLSRRTSTSSGMES